MKNDNIPNELILNWDQTGVNLVPVSNWTMEETGSKQVKVLGSDDKRQITALLASTLSGKLLPLELIYQGLTDACHPKVNFLKSWHVTHSENHWSNEKTMCDYIDNVIIPYVERTRENYSLDKINQPALAIFDVFKAQRSEKVLDKLNAAGIRVVFVPASCTDRLQPLDQLPNKVFKDELKNCFQTYYAEAVAKRRKLKTSGESSDHVDLRTSIIKPLHAKWIIKTFQKIAKDKEMFIISFNLVGIERECFDRSTD